MKQLQDEIHQNAVAHGFWNASVNFGDKIALMHSELSEALEEYRKGTFEGEPGAILHPYMRYTTEDGKPEGIVVELADAVIRILDICGWLGVDIDEAIAAKMAYNATRPYMHGGRTI